MNIILLSGGSGKRLWPLSNDTMSKQFLSLLPTQDGGTQSMVERVYSQIKAADSGAHIVVSTNASQKSSIIRQLGEEAEIVEEPERRNTFPAIMLAAAYLYYEKGLPLNETVIVLPIDVFAEESYFNNLFTLESAVKSGEYNLMLMGARPSYPSEKYGYILPEKYEEKKVMSVKGFKEKPSIAEAATLISEGALWNCGIFAFQLSYAIEKLKAFISAESYAEVLEHYGEITKDSFDYQVVEKEDSIGVYEYSGIWKDLGTWNTLTEEMGCESVGRDVQIAEGSENTHVLNMLDIPLITLGVKDAVVVASHDGILVCDKAESAKLKAYAEKVVKRPMYERRLWGDYRVLDYTVDEAGNATLTKRLHLIAGKMISYQYHHIRTEVWTVTSGEGVLMIDGDKRIVRRGDVITIPVETKHGLKAETDLELIEVQIGCGELVEEDIVRLALEW